MMDLAQNSSSINRVKIPTPTIIVVKNNIKQNNRTPHIKKKLTHIQVVYYKYCANNAACKDEYRP